jgi:hypothetical protein
VVFVTATEVGELQPWTGAWQVTARLYVTEEALPSIETVKVAVSLDPAALVSEPPPGVTATVRVKGFTFMKPSSLVTIPPTVPGPPVESAVASSVTFPSLPAEPLLKLTVTSDEDWAETALVEGALQLVAPPEQVAVSLYVASALPRFSTRYW